MDAFALAYLISGAFFTCVLFALGCACLRGDE